MHAGILLAPVAGRGESYNFVKLQQKGKAMRTHQGLSLFCACVALIGIGGCASTPPDPDLSRTFIPVQAHQTKDLNMTCEDLTAEIHQREEEVSALDKQLAFAHKQSQDMAMMAAFSGFSAVTANNAVSAQLASANESLANAAGGMAGQAAMTKDQLRSNLNQRHDALMQIYFARACKVI